MIDIRSLAEKAELDEEDYIPLLEIFVRATEKDISALETALAAANAEEVASAAHHAKGAAANLELDTIRDAAQSAENAGKAGTLDGVAADLDIIRSEVQAIKQALAAR